jgi:hypothetical protein
MKPWQVDRRVDALSEKLKSVSSDVVRLDFDSFSEPEKQLFRKIWEIQSEYGDSPPADVIEANREFVFKASEIVAWRVIELFMFVVKELLGSDEVEEWYFKLHFYNFFADLSECLERVRNWSEKDREEFLCDMKQNDMMNKTFRIPRGSNNRDTVRNKKKRGEKDDG